MKKNNTNSKIIIISFIIVQLIIIGNTSKAQQLLMFGTVQIEGKIVQGRFEVFRDSLIKTIVYAPYGVSPTTFKDVKQNGNQLTFTWQIRQTTYNCRLLKQNDSAFKGNCF